MPFGGMLGSTFNFVFETQLEALQNADRFYYLSRTAGLELRHGAGAELVRATGHAQQRRDPPAGEYLPDADVHPRGQLRPISSTAELAICSDPTGGIMINGVEVTPLVIRDNPATPGPDSNYLQYTGEDHVVLGGTAGQ